MVPSGRSTDVTRLTSTRSGRRGSGTATTSPAAGLTAVAPRSGEHDEPVAVEEGRRHRIAPHHHPAHAPGHERRGQQDDPTAPITHGRRRRPSPERPRAPE